jgi:hypothetical protein
VHGLHVGRRLPILMLPSAVVVNDGLSIDNQSQSLGDIDVGATNRLVDAGNRKGSTLCLCEDVANLVVFWTAWRCTVGGVVVACG